MRSHLGRLTRLTRTAEADRKRPRATGPPTTHASAASHRRLRALLGRLVGLTRCGSRARRAGRWQQSRQSCFALLNGETSWRHRRMSVPDA